MINYHLNALDAQGTSTYIDHRLKVAGAKAPIFGDRVKRLIFEGSGGIPRVINGIADMVLWVGFERQRGKIDISLVEEVIETTGKGLAWVTS